MKNPHGSWASVYDLAYEQSYGELYQALTLATIERIRSVIRPPARIVDFGAGTGRLSIPLSSDGYDVLAVEPCREMLDQLTNKPGGTSVSKFNGKMQDFHTDTPFDMAICVFTVILYLLDENSLRKSIWAAANAIKPGGLMLIDIPLRALFKSYQINTSVIQRSVTVSSSQEKDIYLYSEHITLKRNGHTTSFTDKFYIRYWDVKDVLLILSECGFSVKKDMSTELEGAGSQYFLLKKEKT
jgi:2-polyprenyl-3-methyl-5-hydroxy-6-metoxy-1,4-benzoquinol methylase